MRRLFLACLAAAATLSAAQPSGDLAELFPVSRFPDSFYEVTSEQTGWGTTTGWIHAHWLGGWEASGEAQVTRLQQITTFCDPDLRLPPVMEEITLRLEGEDLSIVRVRSITAGMPDEIIEMPVGTPAAPVPLEEGRVWTAADERFKRWMRIEALDVPSPHRMIDTPCARTISVTAERRSGGLVAISVSETWWARGHGPLQVIEASDVRDGLDFDALDPAGLSRFIEEREAMPQHATLVLSPPHGE